ncbi:hypothetical protein M408DRAFT_330236 [Serendipita vermifera MAFF 305830]|uniref:Uncharacterized protein n=1 Tax=Serendipita vermifera MAFF 305830 TaxID=933852 RepID=A0A0C2XDJ9_SERVB|nr:hypothetical protein M408DRAFT_330236 [Serendipita vermifera MAFF 305830]
MTSMKNSSISDCCYSEYDVVDDITTTFAKLRTILSEEAITRKKLNELFIKQKEEAEAAVRKAQEHLAFVNDEQANMRDIIRQESEVAKEEFNRTTPVQLDVSAEGEERELMEKKKKGVEIEEEIKQMEAKAREDAEQLAREQARQVAEEIERQRLEDERCQEDDWDRLRAPSTSDNGCYKQSTPSSHADQRLGESQYQEQETAQEEARSERAYHPYQDPRPDSRSSEDRDGLRRDTVISSRFSMSTTAASMHPPPKTLRKQSPVEPTPEPEEPTRQLTDAEMYKMAKLREEILAMVSPTKKQQQLPVMHTPPAHNPFRF